MHIGSQTLVVGEVASGVVVLRQDRGRRCRQQCQQYDMFFHRCLRYYNFPKAAAFFGRTGVSIPYIGHGSESVFSAWAGFFKLVIGPSNPPPLSVLWSRRVRGPNEADQNTGNAHAF
jgi:hypothetical protein